MLFLNLVMLTAADMLVKREKIIILLCLQIFAFSFRCLLLSCWHIRPAHSLRCSTTLLQIPNPFPEGVKPSLTLPPTPWLIQLFTVCRTEDVYFSFEVEWALSMLKASGLARHAITLTTRPFPELTIIGSAAWIHLQQRWAFVWSNKKKYLCVYYEFRAGEIITVTKIPFNREVSQWLP